MSLFTKRISFGIIGRRGSRNCRRPGIERLESRDVPNNGVGVQAMYFANPSFSGTPVVRNEPTVDINWGLGAPDPSLPADGFAARYGGQVQPLFTETYTFTVRTAAGDGARLWVDGLPLFGAWPNLSPGEERGTIDLVVGRKYDLLLEYFNPSGPASVQLDWSSAGQAFGVVPASQLYPSERGGVLAERWDNVPGTRVADLTSLPSYPNTPSSAEFLTAFEARANVGDNYGQRLRAVVTPPATGNYTFAIAADDTAELYLSNSADPAGKRLVASVPAFTNPREWAKYPQQRSSPIFLVAGQTYYVEALHKQGLQGNHLAVGWTLPNGTFEGPIAGANLAPVLPEVRVATDTAQAAEDGGPFSAFVVTRAGGTAALPLTVSYRVTGTATPGQDYQTLSGSVTIPAGATSARITVSPTADSAVEPDETVGLSLIDGPGYTLGPTSSAAATAVILNDDLTTPSGGRSVFPGDPLNFSLVGGGNGSMRRVAVSGPGFTSALEVTTAQRPNSLYDFQARENVGITVVQNETLWVVFWARSAGTGPASFNLVFEDNTTYAKSLTYAGTVTGSWQLFALPFASSATYNPGAAALAFQLGFDPQTLQIGGLSLLDFGTSLPPSSLAHVAAHASYVGRSVGDAWRADAQQGIAQLRTAPVSVSALDANGAPLTGAVVSVRQTSQAFAFGTAAPAGRLLSTTPENLRYQSELRRLFNTVTLENDLKWPEWLASRQQALDAVAWLGQRGLTLRGHNLVWPSWYYAPGSVVQNYNQIASAQGTTAANAWLRTTLLGHVGDEVGTLAGKPAQWDVVNEPFANHDFMDLLGNAALSDWYQAARNADPRAQLYLNDYGIFAGQDGGHANNFASWLATLSSQGLLDGVGEQSHYDESSLPGIPSVRAAVQRFAAYGKPITITEFDLATFDEQLQADFLRDYMTLMFGQPSVNGFVQWGFWEGSQWEAAQGAAIYRLDWSKKPAARQYEDLVFGDWWTDVRGTSTGGSYATRGFQGNYEVTVSYGGVTKTVPAVLGPGGLTLNVVMPLGSQIVDDADPAFTTTGSWTSFTGQGYRNTVRFAAAGSGADAATWTLGVAPGVYHVAATWFPHANRATDAPYTVLDGTTTLGTVRVNQQLTPADFNDSGAAWKDLGTFTVTSNSLSVKLTSDANGFVIADAIRAERVGNLAAGPRASLRDGATDVPSGGSVLLGSTLTGAPLTYTFTVRNLGSQTLTLGTVTLPTGYSLAAGFGSTSLASGASTTFAVRLDAAAAGAYSGAVSVATNDPTANPFAFVLRGAVTAVPALQVADDGDSSFSTVGTWMPFTGQGFRNTVRFAAAGSGADAATWTFAVAPGRYRVSATWSPYANRATNAPYAVFDGAASLGTVRVNQQLTPADFTDSGASWKDLGTFNVTGNALSVKLTSDANGFVIADAIRVERVGDLGRGPMQALVPAYFYPSGNPYWGTLTTSAAATGVNAILNPNSGPGTSADPNYVTAVNNLRAAGGHVFGYVHTSYGARALGTVEAEIDSYVNFYAVDGIFIDEMSNDNNAAHLTYYATVYNYVKSKNPVFRVIGNPGTNTQEAYLTRPTADVLVIFEDTASNYAAFAPSAWVSNYTPDHFAHIIHSEPSAASLARDLGLAALRNAGLVYVTNDVLSNPYDTLPPYWTQEAAAIALAGAVQTADDGDPSFGTVGTWTSFTGQGFRNTVRFAAAGSGADAATWSFSLTPGVYHVAAAWFPHANRANDAPYTVLDGTTTLGTVRVNQQLTPADFADAGASWKDLGTFTVTNGALSVKLRSDANGFVIADAVRVERVGDLAAAPRAHLLDGSTDVPPGGSVLLGTTSAGVPLTHTFTVRNLGSQTLTLGTVTLPTGYSLAAGFGATSLASGASTTFAVRLDAAAAGTYSGTVTFATNDPSASPFAFVLRGAVSPPVQIVDNADAAFTTTGSWTSFTGQGYRNTVHFVAAGSGADAAAWAFAVAPGLYRVSATWSPFSNRATNAPYTVFDGATSRGTVRVSQQQAPADFSDAGASWKDLGTFTIAGNSLVVKLTNDADGFVIADAIRIERVGD